MKPKNIPRHLILLQDLVCCIPSGFCWLMATACGDTRSWHAHVVSDFPPHTDIHIHIHTHTHTNKHTNAYRQARTHAHIYVHTHTYTHVCTHTRTYTHTLTKVRQSGRISNTSCTLGTDCCCVGTILWKVCLNCYWYRGQTFLLHDGGYERTKGGIEWFTRNHNAENTKASIGILSKLHLQMSLVICEHNCDLHISRCKVCMGSGISTR